MEPLLNWLRPYGGWVCAGVGFIVTAALISLVVHYWEWFATEPCGMESRSTTARNLGILLFGLIAIAFAIWRGVVAGRHAKASKRQAQSSVDQAQAAQDQSETSQRGLLNERYQRGAEMLGSSVLAVRLGGIYALQDLAEDHPEQYHIKVMRLFCAFVRSPTKARDDKSRLTGVQRELSIKDYELPEDVQEVMTAISNRSDFGIALEKKAHFRLKLKGAVLPFVQLPDAKLSSADLSYVNFYSESPIAKEEAKRAEMIIPRADLTGADLSGAFLHNANLTNAHLGGATFSRAYLVGANLTGAVLGGGKDLTQALVNETVADPENPPDLRDAHDPKTKKPLNWGGGLPDEFL